MSHRGQLHLKTITRARPVSLKPPIQHLLCAGALKGAWGACTRRLFWRLNSTRRDTLNTTFLCWLHCRVVSGRLSRSFLGPKLAQKSDLLRFTYITHLFGLSWTRLNAIIMIVSCLKVWLGIALLPSGRGLYLARHLSTLYQNCLCVFVRWKYKKSLFLSVDEGKTNFASNPGRSGP